MQRRLEGDLAQMRNALADLQSRPEQNVGAVVAEVKVLQSLVERLYSARAAPARRNRPPPRRPLAPAAKPAAPAAPATNGAASGGPSLPMPPVAEGLGRAGDPRPGARRPARERGRARLAADRQPAAAQAPLLRMLLARAHRTTAG